MAFQEYPKKLHHPEHAPAIWKTLEGKGTGLFVPDTICTQPERFPDVTVTTLDQEKQYASKGYRPANIPDPSEYERAILDAQPAQGHAFQEFPKYKYHPIKIPVIVKNKEEERALGRGWHDLPVEATEEDLEQAEAEQQAAAHKAADSAPAAPKEERPAAVAASPAVQKKKRKTKGWTDERRAEASARMLRRLEKTRRENTTEDAPPEHA